MEFKIKNSFNDYKSLRVDQYLFEEEMKKKDIMENIKKVIEEKKL